MIKRLTGFVAALCIALLGAIAPSAATDGAGLSPVAYNYDAQDVASLIANTTFERGPPARTYAQTALGAVDQSDGLSARPEVAEGHGYTTYDDAALPAHIASAMGTTRGPAPVASGDFMALQCTRVAAKSADTVVLGHYPEYVDLAKATGGRTFQVPTKVWDSMSPTEQWAANQKFLDRAIARGSNVQLATPANAAREGSFFERELQYMQSRGGYSVGPDGTSLIAPGGP